LLRWLSYAALAGAALNRLRPRSRWAALLFVPRLFSGALSPLLALLGLFTAWLGWRRDLRTCLAGTAAAWLSIQTIRRVTAPQDAFEAAFGDAWRARLSLQQQARMLRRRWTPWLNQPPAARIQRDVIYWTLPEGRDLLCDIVLPPPHIQPSGMALIYAHASAWHYGDKGAASGYMFQHLAAQGHVVMDVAYRLAPETDCAGMIADLKRAVAYLKQQAEDYRINPERIVMSGVSAAGQLALVAAYSANDDSMQPDDVALDCSVRAAISFYGVMDLRSLYDVAQSIYQHSRPYLGALEGALRTAGMLAADDALISPDTIMRNLLGCLPDEDPESYRQMSPLYRVGSHCPPTLLLHGEADSLVPVAQVRQMQQALCDAGVQSVFLEVPDADHGFDLILPQASPPAQITLYAVERFMALLA
jgi:acetyl esterase/lipase